MTDTDLQWVRGDATGLDIPATGEALREGGPDYLTRAFQASGALAADNRVTAITRAEGFAVGGTGSKLLLDVDYTRPGPPRQLFVKFSRNFSDPIRDRSRHMLAPEVRFAALSRKPGFPIRVAECLFADFHADSGTGLLVTERVAYDSDGVEPHYLKCMDRELPEPVEHYRAIMRCLARLAGTHRAGRLAPEFYCDFPFDLEASLAQEGVRYDRARIERRVARIGEFVAGHPRLFPANIRDPAFLVRFAAELPQLLERERDIRLLYLGEPEHIALCHWNANIDNAWFWRGADGRLDCGLIDWGHVGQMSIAQSIYGAFSGADTALWDDHLEHMVDTFAGEFERCGGPPLDRSRLLQHILLVTCWMGLAYLLDAPAIIERRLPGLEADTGVEDPRIRGDEDARVQLHMLTMFLNQWQTRDLGGLAQRLLARKAGGDTAQEKPDMGVIV